MRPSKYNNAEDRVKARREKRKLYNAKAYQKRVSSNNSNNNNNSNNSNNNNDNNDKVQLKLLGEKEIDKLSYDNSKLKAEIERINKEIVYWRKQAQHWRKELEEYEAGYG